MNSTPRVSVVLPTYNGQRYLRDAISSVLEQDYWNFELIIVDDASTDETPRIIAECARDDIRVRALRNELNRKLPASLNVGFVAARGEYLTWTSDDNLFRPTAIASMVSSLDAHPEVGLVYADMLVIDESGHVVGPAGWVRPPEYLGEGCCVGACFLYRRTLMEGVGAYDEAMTLAEDYDFWLRASVHAPLLHLCDPLYFYRTHGQSLTATQSDRGMLAHLRCQLKNIPSLTWLDRSERARLLAGAAWVAIDRGEKDLARDCLLSAIRLHPATVLLGRWKTAMSVVLPRRLVDILKRTQFHRIGALHEDTA